MVFGNTGIQSLAKKLYGALKRGENKMKSFQQVISENLQRNPQGKFLQIYFRFNTTLNVCKLSKEIKIICPVKVNSLLIKNSFPIQSLAKILVENNRNNCLPLH
ncbi:CLUMA_CG009364, isoform A [Clunio marinus]|uniref:CLUMA_CG009364, isoform A n=1 Tax=Clunio marinus TaxID=568069 RepID=A0A1J1IAD7_9DIPT|nr:CLUMA_CG009364, isoform A [Clunio marinus]